MAKGTGCRQCLLLGGNEGAPCLSNWMMHCSAHRWKEVCAELLCFLEFSFPFPLLFLECWHGCGLYWLVDEVVLE